MMATYKWQHPSEWLEEYLTNLNDANKLLFEAKELASKLDGDEIQDLYQSEMDADGYFDPEPEP